MIRILIAATLATIADASAASPYTSDGGHQYNLVCTRDGYRLSSLYPVSRFVGSGAGTRAISQREVLSLGQSCDAFTNTLGYGEWCWANGGFRAEFPSGTAISFPRQELFCERPQPYESNCLC